MIVHANVMIQNEALILPEVYKYWKDYPVDKWVFYDDNSTDNTVEVISDLFGDKAIILKGRRTEFNESHNRQEMLSCSRWNDADFVLAIDADELLSQSWLDNWEPLLELNTLFDLEFFWYNVVGEIGKFRTDPMYQDNYRTFMLPMKSTGNFDLGQYKYHTPRTPPVCLERRRFKDAGVIHLQGINLRYYALKQLWYKHYEYKKWNHPIDYINQRYDPVVNGFNFHEEDTPEYILGDMTFDASIYDKIADVKGYEQFIRDHYVPELVTFGKQFLEGIE
jgi:glycosyltransferase involved in cell wall biosynthesis